MNILLLLYLLNVFCNHNNKCIDGEKCDQSIIKTKKNKKVSNELNNKIEEPSKKMVLTRRDNDDKNNNLKQD